MDVPTTMFSFCYQNSRAQSIEFYKHHFSHMIQEDPEFFQLKNHLQSKNNKKLPLSGFTHEDWLRLCVWGDYEAMKQKWQPYFRHHIQNISNKVLESDSLDKLVSDWWEDKCVKKERNSSRPKAPHRVSNMVEAVL